MKSLFSASGFASLFIFLGAWGCDGYDSNGVERRATATGNVTVDKTSDAQCKSGDSTSESASLRDKVEQLVQQKCISCHKSQAPNFTSYDQILAKGKAITDAVNAGKMPPKAPLSAEDKATVANWWKEAKGSPLQLLAAEKVLNYENVIKPLMDRKCVGCHSEAAPAEKQKQPFFTSFENVKANAVKIQARMTAGTMPPATASVKLVRDDVASFSAWVAAGFPQAAPSTSPTIPAPSTTPDPAKVAVYYVDAIKTFLDGKCVSCHKTGGTSPDLSSYKTASAAAAKSLASMKAGTMPPGGKLGDADIAKFAAWVDAGTPEAAGGTNPTGGDDAKGDPGKQPNSNNATKPDNTNNADGCSN